MSTEKPVPDRRSSDGRIRGAFIRLTVIDDEGRRERWLAALHVLTVEALKHARGSVRARVTVWPFKAMEVTESEEEILALLEQATQVRIEGVGMMTLATLFQGAGTSYLKRVNPLPRPDWADLPLSGSKEEA